MEKNEVVTVREWTELAPLRVEQCIRWLRTALKVSPRTIESVMHSMGLEGHSRHLIEEAAEHLVDIGIAFCVDGTYYDDTTSKYAKPEKQERRYIPKKLQKIKQKSRNGSVPIFDADDTMKFISMVATGVTARRATFYFGATSETIRKYVKSYGLYEEMKNAYKSGEIARSKGPIPEPAIPEKLCCAKQLQEKRRAYIEATIKQNRA